MRKRCLVILGLMGMLAIGCQQSPYMHAHLEMVNAEKRALEDQLYDLEFDYQEACRELEALRRRGDQVSGESSVPGSERTRRGSSSREDSKSDTLAPRVDEGTLVDPRIELPPASDSPSVPMQKSNALPGTPPPIPPSVPPRSSSKSSVKKTTTYGEGPTRTLSLEPADPRVTHIVVNPLLTGGRDFDRQPGDDGIVVVIEPRNRDDAFVPLVGPLTIVVLDPAKTAEEGRIVARWEIDANTAQKSLRNSSTLRGIELRLPWSAGSPQSSRLHLHVRYMTVDNRDLRTDRPLFLNLPGQFTQQWTPRASTRSPSSSAADGSQTADDAGTNALPNTDSAPIADHVNRLTGSPDAAVPVESLPSLPSSPSIPLQTKRPEWRPNR